MKKMLVLTIALALFAANAFAATDVTSTSSITISTGQVFNVSNNVTLRASSGGAVYYCESAHSNGDRVFATNSAAPKIYWKQATSASATSDLTSSPASSDTVGTGFTAL